MRAVSQGEQTIWLPRQADGKDYPDVPKDIAAAADEAHRCFSIQAYRGCVILVRAVVEATCKDQGVTSGTLHAKITEMGNQQLLMPAAVEEAHEIRFLGNEMAHGDFTDPVDSEGAKDMLHLMSAILSEAYQDPAKLARIRARRQAKNQKAP